MFCRGREVLQRWDVPQGRESGRSGRSVEFRPKPFSGAVLRLGTLIVEGDGATYAAEYASELRCASELRKSAQS